MQSSAATANKSFWIVVADEAAAVIYSRERRHSPLDLLMTLDNADARKHTGEIISDRGGRAFDSFGTGRHTMVKEKSSPKRHLAEVFAKEIAERIGKALHDGSCRGYALIAAPRFLGLLRTALASTVTTDPYMTIDKHVVQKDAAFIETLLAGE